MADSHGVFGFQVVAAYHDVYAFNVGDCPNPRLDSSVRNSVLGANNSLCALHLQAQQTDADQFLNEAGKTEKLASARVEVADKIARERSWLPKAVRDLEADEGELFSPGEPHDSNDMERRAWYDALDANTRDAFETEALAGQHVEIIKALARSPVPGRALTLGRACWRAEVERTKPARVRYLETRRLAVAWAEATLTAMARVVTSDPWALTSAETAHDRLTRGHAGRKVG
jgi:hypothetical protein